MSDLSTFPISRRYPAAHPDRLQLYSHPTSNGVKVSIMLEEIGLPYEPHLVHVGQSRTWTPEFLALNPNGKIPAIVDPDGPGGGSFALFESGAILLYLAEKTGRLLPGDPALRLETIQWLFFQMAAVGPTFGQLAYFHKFGGKEIEDKRPHERFRAETERLLSVIDQRLTGREWMMGAEYTIADIALIGWVRNIVHTHGAGDVVGWERFPHARRWLDSALARPAVQRGLDIPKLP
jgi:GST-like protein